MSEDQIIKLCFEITAWAQERSKLMLRGENSKEIDADKRVKMYIRDLKYLIKEESN